LLKNNKPVTRVSTSTLHILSLVNGNLILKALIIILLNHNPDSTYTSEILFKVRVTMIAYKYSSKKQLQNNSVEKLSNDKHQRKSNTT